MMKIAKQDDYSNLLKACTSLDDVKQILEKVRYVKINRWAI